MADHITTNPYVSTEVDYILLSDLANEVGMDKSHLRRYAINNDVELLKIRTPQSQNQKTLAVTLSDAEMIKELRRKAGFGFGENGTGPIINAGEDGAFYLVLLTPEFSQSRIKLGFAGDLPDRLASHRTVCPTLSVVKTWACKRSWEKVAIECASVGCQRIGAEVFDCADINALISRLDAFFSLLPEV